jgi:SAM-dependent methyltransferase
MLRQFTDSQTYWLQRYAQGRDSGPGSHDKLAKYKAEILNHFVVENQIASVIEFGCGDGNQLQLANYPHYIGYDISPTALAQCRDLFKEDSSKSFHEMKEYQNESAELTLSLDVIYHLTEDDIFDAYMRKLFSASRRFVIIYSSNQIEQDEVVVAHVLHRLFTAWVDLHQPDWKLIQHIPNRYSFADDPVMGSFADFYIYERQR